MGGREQTRAASEAAAAGEAGQSAAGRRAGGPAGRPASMLAGRPAGQLTSWPAKRLGPEVVNKMKFHGPPKIIYANFL